MSLSYIVFLLCIVFSTAKNAQVCFPNGFMFGTATASYQVEGGWNEGGKTENIWDELTHDKPESIFDRTNGDIACDSYHKYKNDVKLLKQLGVDFYRFSISWSRILPDPLTSNVNSAGVKFYNDLIDELLANRIIPLVTMYHWDLPQTLQELGGWTNPIMADYFVDYANVLFNTFGDRVKHWITFNEPLSFCQGGYGGSQAPATHSSGIEDYMCGHNVLRSHALTYDLYVNNFKETQKGLIAITIDFRWIEPASDSNADLEAAERARQFLFGWFAHPILSREGDYPPVMRKRIDYISKRQGFPRSRLPYFTENEIQMLKGSTDFLGLNHYSTSMAAAVKKETIEMKPSFYNDLNVKTFYKREWPTSNSTWLRVVPWGFRKAVNWIKESYDNPPVVVTENGVSTHPGLNDQKRIDYMDSYLRNLHDAIVVDKCNIKGYTYWSLMDNFEWLRGFSERFGLFEVDFNSQDRNRTARASASYFTTLTTTKCLPEKTYRDWYYISN